MYEYEGKRPQLGEGCYIAPEATLIGEVTLGDYVNVWPQAVIRADMAPIEVGAYTSIQDGVILHPDTPFPVRVGAYCIVGHKAILHGCVVEDECLIGMGSIILDGAVVGKGSMVGAGTLIPPGKKVPPGVLVLGNPYKVIRELEPEELAQRKVRAEEYCELASKHRHLVPIPRI